MDDIVLRAKLRAIENQILKGNSPLHTFETYEVCRDRCRPLTGKDYRARLNRLLKTKEKKDDVGA